MNDGDRISVGGISADIVIDTGNIDGTLDKVRQGLSKVDQSIAAVQASMGKAGGYTKALEQELDNLVDTKTRLTKAESDLTAAMQASAAASAASAQATRTRTAVDREAAEAADRVRQRMGGASLAAISASRAFQDVAQSGPAAALNNLEFITYGVAKAFGATTTQAMALGGAAQGVATVALLLYQNWDSIQEAMSSGIPTPALEGLKALETQLKAVSKEVDELAKKGRFGDLAQSINDGVNRKFAASLEGAAKEQKAVDDLSGPTKEEQARGRAFADAVREQGGDAVKEAVTSEFKARAETEGRKLSPDELNDFMKSKGIAGGVEDKSFWQQAKEVMGVSGNIDQDKLSAIGEMLGVDFDAERFNERFRGEGVGVEAQIREQLANQQFMRDERSDQMMTPEAMARRRLAEGTAGNKEAGDEITGILDGRLGDPANFVGSKFGQEFGENSPEGKAAAKAASDKLKADEKARKDAAKDREAEEKAIDDDLEDSIKLMRDTRRKNKQNRERNEKEGREAAPGVGSVAENLAMQALGGGITPDQARKQIADQLMANGRNAKQATAAAEDIFKDADNDVREGVTKRLLEGRQEKVNPSEQFDASTLAARFQSSVGGSGDDSKKLLSVNERMEKHLEAMAKAGVLNVRIKKT